MSDSVFYGTDIMIDDDMKIGFAGNDFKLASGIERVLQAIKKRLKTPKGSLFYDLTYGSELYKFVQTGFTKEKLSYFESMIKDCLKNEPLIKSDSITISTVKKDITGFYCRVSFGIYNYDNDLNLVISADKVLKIWSE
ncbi:MAG: DUF2634 domain-containing protein [Spirochaetes bacterium]|nr:DUF2634 domain-containing protein [Spirochaetota bacterium]